MLPRACAERAIVLERVERLCGQVGIANDSVYSHVVSPCGLGKPTQHLSSKLKRTQIIPMDMLFQNLLEFRGQMPCSEGDVSPRGLLHRLSQPGVTAKNGFSKRVETSGTFQKKLNVNFKPA
jgi:hypothetical protein